MVEPELTERDWKVIKYIKENPGCSKEKVVKGMNGDPSRITVLNILDKLEYENMIDPRKEKKNSQIYKLFINDDNAIIPIKQLFDDFKNSYFNLVDKSKGKIASKESDKRLINALSMLYEHFVGLCIFATFYTWPEKITKKEDLNKLSIIIFDNLKEMQSKLIDIISIGYVLRVKQMTRTSYPMLHPSGLHSVVTSLRDYGLYDQESEKPIDLIWKITFDLLSDNFVNDYFGPDLPRIKYYLGVNDLKNWREVVEKFDFMRKLDRRKRIETQEMLKRKESNGSGIDKIPLSTM